MVNYAYGKDLLVVRSDFHLHGLSKSEVNKPNVFIKKDDNLKPPSLQSTNVFRAGLQARYAFHENTHFLEWPDAVLFAINQNNEISYQSNLKPKELSLFASNEVLGICLHQLGFQLLHAAAIEIDDKGFIFAGEPGAGKSTLVAALGKHGARLLSDDLSIITTHNDQLLCHQGLQESKLWEKSIAGLKLDSSLATPMFQNHSKYYYPLTKSTLEAVPLEKIIFLSKDENSLALGLTQYFPLPNQILQGDALKQHFQTSSSLLRSNKLLRLTPFSTFESLENWAKNFIQSHA